MDQQDSSWGSRAQRAVRHLAIEAERQWDGARMRRRGGQIPEDFRIVPYLGMGSPGRAIVRGRVLDNPEPTDAIDGEGAWAATRRTASRFLTHELPGVPLRLRVGTAEAETTSDGEGYFTFDLKLPDSDCVDPWTIGQIGLAGEYRGLTDAHITPVQIRVPGPGARFGIVSDIDDTILHTGAQRVVAMIRQTLVGSELTRTPFIGAPELYRALARQRSPHDNPVFYVSSSPWNLHGFLRAFLIHRGFPLGPLLLRDLLGTDVNRSTHSHKAERIDEILSLHPELPFVLLGDSGQHDPEIYADAVRRHPGRFLAVYIREVRLDPGDRRVELVADAWDHDVPFVLAGDSAEVADHAAGLGLITRSAARAVARATHAEH